MDNCDYRLQTCVWEITLACCFSCRYCGSKAGKAREGELSTEECLDVARQLADMGCRAGLTGIGIDSVGNIRGCESMCDDFFIEGNIRKRSLYEIWNDPDSFSYNRKFTVNQLSGNCRKCEYNTRCAGGCRSYNYFLHGKMYESLRCAKNAINFGNSIFSHKS